MEEEGTGFDMAPAPTVSARSAAAVVCAGKCGRVVPLLTRAPVQADPLSHQGWKDFAEANLAGSAVYQLEGLVRPGAPGRAAALAPRG